MVYPCYITVRTLDGEAAFRQQSQVVHSGILQGIIVSG